jgi:hypothetical protein
MHTPDGRSPVRVRCCLWSGTFLWISSTAVEVANGVLRKVGTGDMSLVHCVSEHGINLNSEFVISCEVTAALTSPFTNDSDTLPCPPQCQIAD